MNDNTPAHDVIPVALRGYSPVSYFQPGGPTPGNAQHTAEYDGVHYFFTSQAEAQLFRQDPPKYLPAFGGWCAYGAAIGKHFTCDPTNYKIVDGKLMLFLKNDEVDARQLWDAGDEPKLVNDAEAFYDQAHGSTCDTCKH